MTSFTFDPANDDLVIAKPRKEIVFIEDNVADYQTIAANAGAGRQVVILDSSKDGLEQIADAVKGMSDIDALHIVTHGSEGRIGLGTLTLDQAAAAQHQDVLATIGASLAAGGDMLFYGCSVGAGQGAGLLNQLAIATGADVAASNDATGDASLGGDWNLELASGNIETAPFVDAALAAQYHALLNIPGPVTLDFETLPNSAGATANDDIDYTLPGQPGYSLKFNGKSDAVWSYSAYSNTYLSFSPNSMEDKVTIAFTGGQQFTPTSIKVNGNQSSNQTLLFTGLRADNTEVMHASVDVIAGASINDFVLKNLSGFTNITTLVITAQGGGIIQYFQMDDLVMSNIQQAPPKVSFVTSTTANGAYNADKQIDIVVSFDSVVDVTGTPQLKLETGATDRVVNYVSGSGTSNLTFRYTVQAGDTSADLDYFGTGALSLNGGTIKVHSGTTDADLTLFAPGSIASLGANKAIVIDGVAPNLTITSNKSALKAGDTATITFTFSEDPGSSFAWDGSSGDVSVSGGTLSAISGSGTTRTATFTPTANTNSGSASISVGAGKYNDTAGNNNTVVSNGPAITYDTLLPTVTVSSDKSTLKAGETATITFTFSEDPGASFTWSGSAGDVAVSGGTLSAISGSGLIRTATFTPAASTNNGTASVSVNNNSFADAAGNINNTGGASPSITFDTKPPTLTITSDKATLKAGDTATITFTFSEDPGASFSWDGVAGDLAVSGGTLSPLSGSGAIRTATFTPTADTNAGTASITVTADSYQDTSGNLGTAGLTPSLSFDTRAPAAPSAPDLDKDSDSGALDTDNLTHETALVFIGTADPGTTVRLYDSDGSTEIGHATANATDGTWTITTSTLLDGDHTVTAKAFDAAGNASAASVALPLKVDSTKPAAMAAPAFKTGSDSGIAGDGITNVKKPTFTGSAEAFAQITLYDGGSVLGTVTANASGVWEFTPAADLLDGVHTISARQTDRAGNSSDAGTVLNLTIDTVIPATPAPPVLAAASDTDTQGDGITENDRPVIEGTAQANTLVTLYDIAASGKVTIGSTTADGSGKWSISAGHLSTGSHSLSVTQSDAAGNESAHSTPFVLRIDAPPEPTTPVTLIDGVAVDIQPVSLPGGVVGSAVSIPVVGAGRVESSGSAGVADIPLATGSGGGKLLLAQVAPGYGLSASGANVPVANAAELLLASIKAATPSHTGTDQGHLTGNGQAFLDGLAAGGSLLVETVKPVSGATPPAGTLKLSAPAPAAGQSTALVIDTSGLAAGSTIALQKVDFAAVIGAANVVTSSSMVLSGDAASQHFTVTGGGSGSVFAGGGADTLGFGAAGSQAPAPVSGITLLHGGSANDVASFSGARADYDLDFHNGYIVVTSHANPGVKATVVNVEQLQFSDASIAVENNADMDTLAGIYQTVLGRQADMHGIEFWADVHQAGTSWGAIALSIIGSAEQTAGHSGFNGDAAHDLTLLYSGLFNRTPDAAGLAYWTNAMAHGFSLEQVASSIVQSVEMVGHQRAALDWDFTTG